MDTILRDKKREKDDEVQDEPIAAAVSWVVKAILLGLFTAWVSAPVLLFLHWAFPASLVYLTWPIVIGVGYSLWRFVRWSDKQL